MNITYDYYLLNRNNNTYPSWITSERYFYCENFSRFFSFFRKKQ